MMTEQTAPTGRLMRKHHRQVVELAIAPPTRGPAAAAMAHVAPIPEVHFARSLTLMAGGLVGGVYRREVISAMMMLTRPIIPPPPAPWMTREAISMFML